MDYMFEYTLYTADVCCPPEVRYAAELYFIDLPLLSLADILMLGEQVQFQANVIVTFWEQYSKAEDTFDYFEFIERTLYYLNTFNYYKFKMKIEGYIHLQTHKFLLILRRMVECLGYVSDGQQWTQRCIRSILQHFDDILHCDLGIYLDDVFE